MNNAVRFSLFFCLVGTLLMGSGCAQKKKASRLNALEAQVGVLTDELTRLDQSVQEMRGSAQAAPGGRAFSGESHHAGAGVYRTPSGFELPSMNIQQALKNAGYYQGNLDGKIGSETKDAVKSFQKDHGLEADGVIGRRTWDKLKGYLGGAVK